MFATRYLLPSVALLGLVSAQTSAICTGTATINSQADATAIASSCSTVGGISISSGIVGAISLDGIQQIKGDLTCVGAKNMTGLSGKDLSSIGKSMTLDSLFILADLSFPSLSSVNTILWQHLNGLQQLGFSTTGVTEVSSLTISDTPLTALDGINLVQVDTININNNRYLNSFTSKVANITGGFNMDANGPMLTVSFPNLIYAYNMTFRNVSSISIPQLQVVNTTFGVYDSMDLTEVKAPNLTAATKGDMAFINNPSLSNVSMPALTTVGGGLTISADKSLLIIDGFPSLKTTGAINMSGNFTSVSLPALADCKGTFNMQSSGNISCDPFAYDQSHQVIKGEYKCTSASTNVQSTVGQGAGSSTGTGASPTSTKGAAPISSFDMPSVMGFSAFIGALVQMLL